MAAVDPPTSGRTWSRRGCNRASAETSTHSYHDTSLQFELHLISQAWIWKSRNVHLQSQSLSRRQVFAPPAVPESARLKPTFPNTASSIRILPGEHTKDALTNAVACQDGSLWPHGRLLFPNTNSQRTFCVLNKEPLFDRPRDSKVDLASEEGFVHQAKGKKKKGSTSNNYPARDNRHESNGNSRGSGGSGRDPGNGDTGIGGATGGRSDGDDDDDGRSKDKDASEGNDDDPRALSTSKPKRSTDTSKFEVESTDRPNSVSDAAPDPPDVFDDVGLGESPGKFDSGFSPHDGKTPFGAWGQKWNPGWGRGGSSTGNLQGINTMDKKLSIDMSSPDGDTPRSRKHENLSLALDEVSDSEGVSRRSKDQSRNGGNANESQANEDRREGSAGAKKSKLPVPSRFAATSDWPVPSSSLKDRKLKKDTLVGSTAAKTAPGSKGRDENAWGTGTNPTEQKTIQPDSELMENVWTSGTTRDKLKRRAQDQIADPAPRPARQKDMIHDPVSEKAEDEPWGFRSKPPKWEKKEPKLSLQPSAAVGSAAQPSLKAAISEPRTTLAPTRNAEQKATEIETEAEEEEDDEEESGGLWAALSGKKEKKKKKPDSSPHEMTPPKPGDEFWDGLGGNPKDSAKVIASASPPVEKGEGWSFWGFGSRKKKTETPAQTPVELPQLEETKTPSQDPPREDEEVEESEREFNKEKSEEFQESVKEKSKEEVKAGSREKLKRDQKEERTRKSILEDEIEILSKKEKRKKKSSLDRPKEELKPSKSKRSPAWDDWEESAIVRDEKRKVSDVKAVDAPLEQATLKPNTLALEPFKTFEHDDNFDHWGIKNPPRMVKETQDSSRKPDDIEEPTENAWNLGPEKEVAPRPRQHNPQEIVGTALGEIVQPDDVEEVKDFKVDKEDGWPRAFSSERMSQSDKDALAQLPPRAPTPPSFEFHMSGDQAEDPNKVTGDERSLDKSRSRSKEKDRDSDREKEKHKKDKAPKLTEREIRKLEKEKKKAEKAEKERLAREAREAEERARREAEEEAAREAEERVRREAEEEAAREAEEMLAKEAEERAAREAQERETRAAEELAEREAQEKKAREEEEAAEQAAQEAEAAAIIEEEEEMEALKERRAKRGKLAKRDTEKLNRLEQNALRRAGEQAAREAARREEERFAREAEEQAAQEAEAAIIAKEEAEIAALVQKNSKKGKLGKKDAEKLHRLEQDALRRADERAARERLRTGENEDDDEAPEENEEDEDEQNDKGEVEDGEELDIDNIQETELGDQEDEEQLARQTEEAAREAAETAAREAAGQAAREAEEQAAREAREARKRAAREAEEAAANKKSKKSSRSKEIKESRERDKDKDKKDRKSRMSSKSVAAEPATKPEIEPVAELEGVPSAGPVAEPAAGPMADGPGPDAIPEPETLQEHKRELSRLNEAEVEELLSPKEISISNAFNFWGLAGSRKKKPVAEAQRKYPMDGQSNEEKNADDSLPSKSVSGDGADAPQESPSKDEEKARPGSSYSPPPAADEPAAGEKPPQDKQDPGKDDGPEDDEKPPPENEPPRGDGPSSEEGSSPENEASSKKVKAGAKKSDDPSTAGADKAKKKKAQKSEKNGASPRESGKLADRPETKDAKEKATAEAELPTKADRSRDRERVKDKEREKEKDKEKRSSKKQRPRAPADELLSPPPGPPDSRSVPHAEPRSKRPTVNTAARPSSEEDEPLPRREEKRTAQSKTERSSRARAETSADKPTQKERLSKSTRPRALTANEPLIPRLTAAQESRYDPRAVPGGRPSRRYSTESHGLISPPPEEIPPMASKAARIFGVDRFGSRLKSRKANARDDDVLMVGALGNDGPPLPREKHRSRRTLDEDAMMHHGEAPGHPPLKRGLSGLKKGGLSGLFGFMAPKPSKIPSSPDVDGHIDREYQRDGRKERRPEREDRLADDLRRPKEERDRERHRKRRDDSEARRQAEKDARRERRAARQREDEERRGQEDREARKAERHRQRKEREREKEREIEREREERKREGEEAEREAKRQRRKSLVDPSGDEAERQRRHGAKRAARAAEEPDSYRRRDYRKYPLEDQIPSNREGRREVRRAPAAWPHMGTSSWVKDHSGAMPPPDSGEQTDGMAMTEDEIRREERRSQRRREKGGGLGPDEERRKHKREGRDRDSHDRHAHERQARDRDGRDGREGRERTKRVVRSDGSDERHRSRREGPGADSAQRGSWWKKWTA